MLILTERNCPFKQTREPISPFLQACSNTTQSLLIEKRSMISSKTSKGVMVLSKSKKTTQSDNLESRILLCIFHKFDLAPTHEVIL